MEEVPSLNCPAHPISEKTEENVARALTPTKNFPIPTPAPTPDALVLPGNCFIRVNEQNIILKNKE